MLFCCWFSSVPGNFQMRENLWTIWHIGSRSSDECAVDIARKKMWLLPQCDARVITVVTRKHGIDFRAGW
jgi:hypothetical protein